MRYLILILTALGLASCSKDYPVDLPAHASQLVVECYLEDGQPMRALVTESQALLDPDLVPPVVANAVVTVTYAGHVDTLRPLIDVDTARNRVYNYGSSKLVTADFQSGEPYRLDVYDAKGRHAYGVTRFMPPVRIAGITTTRNNEGEISCLTSIGDDPAVKNYYRLILRRNSQRDSIQLNSFFSDELANARNQIVIRSRHRFNSGDSLFATLFHLSPEYYQFLNTSQSASSALGNPFAASGEIVSNISGGLGVFAALSGTELAMKLD